MKRFLSTLILLSVILSSSAFSQRTNKVDQLLFTGQYESAIPLLKQLIAKDSTDSKLYFRLGKAYQNLNQYIPAIENYKKAQQFNPNSTANLFNYSNCLYLSGNYPACQKELIKLQSIDSMHYQGNLLLAKTYANLSNYKKGLSIYEKLIERDSLNPYLHKQAGNLKDRMQNYIGSLASYIKAYQLNSKDLSVILNVIQKFYEMQGYEQALEFCNNGLEAYPNNHLIQKKKAQCLVGLEWYENALSIYLDLEKREKLNLTGYKQLGICLMQTRQYQKAIDAFQVCMADEKLGMNFGKDPMLNFYLGVCFSRLDDYKNGIMYLENSLDYIIPPIKSSMHLYLAKAYSATREFEKAVTEYKNHFDMDETNPEILYEIATTYEEFGDNKKKALKYYSQYINQTEDVGGERYEYAKSRILHIKEKIHFEK
ncbi:tetratricopeptide repeat protein [Marinifilum caeruleilacunae]|uniref:Tetratricopeptide repeat protein n=1 Tax=Marinifilum caeruleilacunae TaxID=2499076 RepID=A0ABX1WYG8_9BACT|nr:tetratricopeptide repeat protein [Marinifilum caeruleilacunae]NOU61154.1 tetratricopeptide repeat protein [Marinifilum caeruleilacunae]